MGRNNIKKTTEQYKLEVLEKHEGRIIVLGEYINNKTKIKHQCNVCGNEWENAPNPIINRRRGCPKCGGTSKYSQSEYIKKVFEKHKDFIIVIGDYKNNRSKITHLCKKCDKSFNTLPNTILLGHGCPKCAKSGFKIDKPATFYTYEIIFKNEKFFGFGISNVFKERNRTHLKTARENNFTLKLLQKFEFENGIDALHLENLFKKKHKDLIFKTSLPFKGFKTESYKII